MKNKILVKLLILIIFSVLMIPYLTNYTKSALEFYTTTISDSGTIDPEDTTYNKFYGPLNAMAIKAGKNLAFSLAHNDQEYLVILFSLFILIPLFIFLILLFKLHDLFYEGRGLTPSLKDTYRYYALISFIMVFFMYFLYRRHIFSNELFYAVISLAIFIFLIKDNFTLKSNFNKALILVLIGASFNIGSLIFSSIIMGIYVFRSLFLLRDSKKILLRSFLVLSLKGTLFLVLLGVFFVYGFDFEGFKRTLKEYSASEHNPLFFYYLPLFILTLWVFLNFLKKFNTKDIFQWFTVMTFTSLCIMLFYHVITRPTNFLFLKRLAFLLPLFFILGFMRFKRFLIVFSLSLLILIKGNAFRVGIALLIGKSNPIDHAISDMQKIFYLTHPLIENLKKMGYPKRSYLLAFDYKDNHNIRGPERFIPRRQKDIKYAALNTNLKKGTIVIKQITSKKILNYYNCEKPLNNSLSLDTQKLKVEQKDLNTLGYEIVILKDCLK